MGKIKFKFNVDVLVEDSDLDFDCEKQTDTILWKEFIEETKKELEKLICDGSEGVTVKIKNFKWEILK